MDMSDGFEMNCDCTYHLQCIYDYIGGLTDNLFNLKDNIHEIQKPIFCPY
jgi:hypothetical protein